MSDIFISYKSSDKERVRILVEALERNDWSVWWDPEIPPGKTWDEIIEEALDNAKCVIAVWSKESVKSNWVKEEAEKGLRRGILVPVLIDDVRIPLGFGRIEAAQLIDWDGKSPHPEFDQLLRSIAGIIQKQKEGGKKQEEAERLEQERRKREALEKTAREEAERKAYEKALKEEAERKPHEEELKRKADKSKGRGISRWIYWTIGILIGLVVVGKLCDSPPLQPPIVQPPSVSTQLYCCDAWGNRRCAMAVTLPIGSPCFCPQQGSGVVCQ